MWTGINYLQTIFPTKDLYLESIKNSQSSKVKRGTQGWKDIQLGKQGNELLKACMNRQRKQTPRLRKGGQVRRGIGDCQGLYYGSILHSEKRRPREVSAMARTHRSEQRPPVPYTLPSIVSWDLLLLCLGKTAGYGSFWISV